jgi:ribonuclease P protein component
MSATYGDPALGSQPTKALSRNSLPAQRRLRQPGEFSDTLKNGRRCSGRFLLLAIRPTERLARLGLAIAKRHIPRACDRNTIKRIAREAFRLMRHSLPAVDVVVLAKAQPKNAPNASRLELREEMNKLLLQIKPFKRSHPAQRQEIAR